MKSNKNSQTSPFSANFIFIIKALVFGLVFGALGLRDYHKGLQTQPASGVVLPGQAFFYTGNGFVACPSDNPQTALLPMAKFKLLGYFYSPLKKSAPVANIVRLANKNFLVEYKDTALLCLQNPTEKIALEADWWIITQNISPTDKDQSVKPKKGIVYANGRAATKAVRAMGEAWRVPVLSLRDFSQIIIRSSQSVLAK